MGPWDVAVNCPAAGSLVAVDFCYGVSVLLLGTYETVN